MTMHARSFSSPHQSIHVDLDGDDVFDVRIPLGSQPHRTVRATSINLTVARNHLSYGVTRGPLLLRSTGEPGKQSLQTPVRLQPEQVPAAIRTRALELAVKQARQQATALTEALAAAMTEVGR